MNTLSEMWLTAQRFARLPTFDFIELVHLWEVEVNGPIRRNDDLFNHWDLWAD